MDREKHSHITVNQYVLILLHGKLINQTTSKTSTYVTKYKDIGLYERRHSYNMVQLAHRPMKAATA
jgi:hypothetical protein